MNLFDYEKPHFKFTHRPIRLFEAFSGYGSQAIALKRLGIEIDHIGISEIDKYAILSHEAIHGKVKNFGDICEIKGKDLIGERIDLFTFSFPCVDLSKAGQQKGLNNTRSGLVFEVIRILKELKELDKLPTVLLMENVPDLLSKKFKEGWTKIYNEIEGLGYTNKVFLMNAKNYGVAQNRERVFMVSIKGEYSYAFPKPFKLQKRLKDYLETKVDEKYYLNQKQLMAIFNTTDIVANTINDMINGNQEPRIGYALSSREFQSRGFLEISPTLVARDYKDPKIILEPNISEPHDMVGLIIPEATKQGYSIAEDGDGIYINRPHQKRGVVQKGMIQTIKTSVDDIGVVVKENRNAKEKLADDLIANGVVKGGEIINHSYTSSKHRPELKDFIESDDGIVPTLTTRLDTLGVVVKNTENYIEHESLGSIDNSRRTWKEDKVIGTITTNKDNSKVLLNNPLRIRKLTPLEAWRLMGIDDEDFYKAKATGMSDSQLYKQAGNSIVVNVLVEIFRQLFD